MKKVTKEAGKIKMGKIVVMDHPLIQHKIGIIRREETGSKDFRTGTLNPHRLKNVDRIAAGKTASFSMMVYTAGTLQAGEGRLDLYFTSAR